MLNGWIVVIGSINNCSLGVFILYLVITIFFLNYIFNYIFVKLLLNKENFMN